MTETIHRGPRAPHPTTWAFLLLIAALAAGCRSAKDGPPALEAETTALPATDFAAGLEAPLDPHANLLWCASLPLAWNELKDLVGGDLRAAGAPPELAWLNADRVARTDVDPSALVARAGFARDGIVEEIQRELVRTFGARDPVLDGLGAASGVEALAYARLEKALRFAVAFEDLEDTPLPFHYRQAGEERTRAVDAFGLDGYDPSKKRHQKLGDQVLVLHHAADDDFVVQLVAEDSTDSLLIARVPPAATLGATWDAVRTRMDGAEPGHLAPGERLLIPELDFDLSHTFGALVGLSLENEGFEGVPLLAVAQDLRLRLDERGMVVRSRAYMALGSAAPGEPRRFVADGAFLVAAIEREASSPYLLAWIGHPEILAAVP